MPYGELGISHFYQSSFVYKRLCVKGTYLILIKVIVFFFFFYNETHKINDPTISISYTVACEKIMLFFVILAVTNTVYFL